MGVGIFRDWLSQQLLSSHIGKMLLLKKLHIGGIKQVKAISQTDHGCEYSHIVVLVPSASTD